MEIIKTNKEIYDLANNLYTAFSGDEVLPIKINFYLQKNLSLILELGQQLDSMRMMIIEKYGQPIEDGQYQVAPENIENANKELNELFSLTQEVKIYMVNLEDFGDCSLSLKQIEAISFMINEEEE